MAVMARQGGCGMGALLWMMKKWGEQMAVHFFGNAAGAAASGETPEYSAQANFDAIAKTFGDGDELRGYKTLYILALRLEHARNRHPVFAEGAAQALGVIGAEYDGLVQAVESETNERQIDEALDVAVTAIRMVNGEHSRRRRK